MKIYISGKITGLPFYEAEKNFQKSENELKERGYEPINPMKLIEANEDNEIMFAIIDEIAEKSSSKLDKKWIAYMTVDIFNLFDCEAIYMQKNWRKSKGARIERAIARELNLVIFYEKKPKKNLVGKNFLLVLWKQIFRIWLLKSTKKKQNKKRPRKP